MELVKNIVISGTIGTLMVLGACAGIVGGSLVLCAASLVGMWISGG